MSTEPIHRTTARVIPVNDAGQVLLLQGHNPARPDEPYWFSIGGGTDADETPPETAVRELREETGVVVAVEQLGQPFHRGRHDYTYGGVLYTAESTFFALRMDAVALTFDGAAEGEIITGAAWFDLGELTDLVLSNDLLQDVAHQAVEHLFPSPASPPTRDSMY